MKFPASLPAFLLAAFALFAAAAADAKTRAALVIGNSDYVHATSLPNPTNDATAIAKTLKGLGFDVVEGYDLGYDDVRKTMRSFARTAKDADIAIFFYAGHGIAVNGINYIVPIDANLNDPIDWEFQVYPVEDIMRLLKYAKGANLVLLDACRDNPMAETLAASMGTSTRSLGARGLSRIDIEAEGTGTAIAFATSPGEVAEDGEGDHSPFTTALLKHIGAANTDFTEVMSRVTGDVYELTDKRQRPWLNTSLTGSVILNPVEGVGDGGVAAGAETATTTGEVASSGGADIDTQKFMIEVARESGDPADYQNYLDVFPQGVFAGLARNAINRAEAEKAEQKAAAAATTQPAAPAQQQTAALAPQQLAPQQQINPATGQPYTRTLSPSGGLALTSTPYVRSAFSSEATEQGLFMDRAQRREVQGRLNSAGFNVGRPDGAFGRKTRAGISSWQAQNGIQPTGYLNGVQYQLLVANTDASYRVWLANQPVASTRPVQRQQPAQQRQQTQSSGSSSSSGGSVAENLLNGLANGIGQGIGRAIFD